MEPTTQAYARINLIANSKIPVSEDSPVYGLFRHRRELCKRYTLVTESSQDAFFDMISHIENDIKQFLLLPITK
jgi:hypothetical protein